MKQLFPREIPGGFDMQQLSPGDGPFRRREGWKNHGSRFTFPKHGPPGVCVRVGTCGGLFVAWIDWDPVNWTRSWLKEGPEGTSTADNMWREQDVANRYSEMLDAWAIPFLRKGELCIDHTVMAKGEDRSGGLGLRQVLETDRRFSEYFLLSRMEGVFSQATYSLDRGIMDECADLIAMGSEGEVRKKMRLDRLVGRII